MICSGKTVELYEIGLELSRDGQKAEHPTGNRAAFHLNLDEPNAQGSSCAVYFARRTDGAGGQVCLKRCLSREAGDEQRFLNTAYLQYTLLEEVNGIAHILGLYRGEDGNLWSAHSYEHGQSYDCIQEESLWQLLRNGRFIAQAIRRTHLQGYLHLDVSPANVFFYTPGSGMEGVAIVDCDSFVPVQRCFAPNIPLYTSAQYGAPEVQRGNRQRIGPASDVYSLGVVLFEKLFDRLPNRREGSSCAPIALEESRMFDQMTVKTRTLLEEFFNHTICISPSARYSDMDSVLEQLEKLIALADPNNMRRPKLCKKNIRPTRGMDCFVPRNDIVRQIREAFLDGRKAVVVLGPSGVGKTESVRQFACEYSREFDGLELAVIENPKDEAAIRDRLTVLNCSAAGEAEDCIRQLDEHDLIILDNYNYEGPEHLQALENFLAGSGRAKVIITTCMARIAELPGVAAVRVESNKQLSLNLFRRVYTRPLNAEDEDHLAAVLKYIGYHTYATDMIALELMEYPELSLAQIRRKCEENRIMAGSTAESEILSSKDGSYFVDSFAGHIKRLFSDILTHDFSPAERSIMVFLTRSPAEYFDAGIVCKIIGDHGELVLARTALNRLIRRNWVKEDRQEERQLISVHPLAAEALRESGVIGAKLADTMTFLRNLCTIVDIPDFDHFYYTICAGRPPLGFPFPAANAFAFVDRLRFAARLHHDRYIYSEQKGIVAFGMSETEYEADYWVYLEQSNVTVSYLRLARGYSITPEDVTDARLELQEKVNRSNEWSCLHSVQQNGKDQSVFDLDAMSDRPCTALTVDLTDLFPKKRMPRFSVLEGPFRGGFAPAHLEVIGQMAFRYAGQWLNSVTIPREVVRINALAFAGCADLKHVEFSCPNAVRRIGPETFAFCGLEEIVLPEGITEIGMGAFSLCRKLRKAVLPEGLEAIDVRLFSLDYNLREIYIPTSVKSIGVHAFSGCPCEESVPKNLDWTPDYRTGWELAFEDQVMGSVPVWRADGSYRLYSEIRKKKADPRIRA